MMSWIFVGMVVISTVAGVVNGRMVEVSSAALLGAGEAVTLSLSLLGALALWNGVMKVGEAAGVTRALSRLFRPVLRFLFPGLPPESAAAQAITLNMSANILGLGNAATPFGLAAMKELDRINPNPQTASPAMVMFVAVNTASLEIIPATAAALRLKNGAESPMDILPAVWLASSVTLITAVTVAKLLTARRAGRSS